MMRIGDYYLDQRAVRDGADMPLGDGCVVRIRGAGYGPYQTTLARELRAAADTAGLAIAALPDEAVAAVQRRALAAHLVIGIDGLVDDTDTPVTVDDFRAALVSGDYEPLVLACLSAATTVGRRREKARADAQGN